MQYLPIKAGVRIIIFLDSLSLLLSLLEAFLEDDVQKDWYKDTHNVSKHNDGVLKENINWFYNLQKIREMNKNDWLHLVCSFMVIPILVFIYALAVFY